jgi:drug/metabolite transporter (DMT)-like permease
MSQSHPRSARARAAADRRAASGSRLAMSGAFVVVALLFVPWVVGRLTSWPPAPAIATFVALAAALFVWFRGVQQTRARTATILALVYAAVAAGVLWAWQSR